MFVIALVLNSFFKNFVTFFHNCHLVITDTLLQKKTSIRIVNKVLNESRFVHFRGDILYSDNKFLILIHRGPFPTQVLV